MPEDPRMGILDDSNPFRGLRPDESTDEERLRTARRIAIASLVMALLWGFGFFSLGGLLCGAGTWLYLRGRDDARSARRIALAAAVVGAAGLVGTLAVFGPAALSGR